MPFSGTYQSLLLSHPDEKSSGNGRRRKKKSRVTIQRSNSSASALSPKKKFDHSNTSWTSKLERQLKFQANNLSIERFRENKICESSLTNRNSRCSSSGSSLSSSRSGSVTESSSTATEGNYHIPYNKNKDFILQKLVKGKSIHTKSRVSKETQREENKRNHLNKSCAGTLFTTEPLQMKLNERRSLKTKNQTIIKCNVDNDLPLYNSAETTPNNECNLKSKFPQSNRNCLTTQESRANGVTADSCNLMRISECSESSSVHNMSYDVELPSDCEYALEDNTDSITLSGATSTMRNSDGTKCENIVHSIQAKDGISVLSPLIGSGNRFIGVHKEKKKTCHIKNISNGRSFESINNNDAILQSRSLSTDFNSQPDLLSPHKVSILSNSNQEERSCRGHKRAGSDGVLLYARKASNSNINQENCGKRKGKKSKKKLNHRWSYGSIGDTEARDNENIRGWSGAGDCKTTDARAKGSLYTVAGANMQVANSS